MAVLTVAAQLFVTKGFHSTTLNDVADRLNITKPAIYYYFTSKDEILIACTHAALDLAKRYFAEDDDTALDGRQRLVRFMIWYGESMTEPFGQCLVRVAEHDMNAAAHKQLVAAKRVMYERLVTLIEAGIDDGSIASNDPTVIAFSVAGALSWLSHWYRPDGEWTAREAAERITNQLLSGLTTSHRRKR